MKRSLVMLLLSAMVSPLCAQSLEKPTLPSGPLLNRAPEFSQWTITVQSVAPPESPGDGKPKPRPAPSGTIRVAKTKNIRVDQEAFSAMAPVEQWSVDGMQVRIVGNSQPVFSMKNGSGDLAFADFSRSDFPELNWISQANFQGVENVSGKECLIFEDKLRLPGEGGVQEVAVRAAIERQSRLPALLNLDEQSRIYVFANPPAAMLVPPMNVRALIENWRQTFRRAAAKPTG